MKRMIAALVCFHWSLAALAAPDAAPAKDGDAQPATPPVTTKKTDQPPATPPVTKQPAKPGAQKEAAAQPSKFKFETPDKKAYTDFPTVPIRTTSLATYIGFQFGSGKDDVAYVCFDTENAQKVADRAYWHVGTNKIVAVHGHNEEVKQQKNVKLAKEKPQRFEFPALKTKVGDADVLYKITCVVGHEARANCHVTVEVVYKEGKSACSFMLHGNLSNYAVPVPNEMKVLPLLGAAALKIYYNDKFAPPTTRPYVVMSEAFIVEPQKGMDDFFTMEVKNKETDRVVEKGKHPIKIPPFSGVGDAGAGDNFTLKSSKAGKFAIAASIHLGPLGDLEASQDVAIAGGGAEKKTGGGGQKKTK